MEGSYSDRKGRRPPITTPALVELVFAKLAVLESDGLFEQAFSEHRDETGELRDPAIATPKEWLITQLARPGLWRSLGNLEQVMADDDFPDWDEDTLLDVVELLHNQAVSAPRVGADGRRALGFDRDAGKRRYRKTMNEALGLREPPLELRDDGRIVEVGVAPTSATPPDRGWDVFLSHASEDKGAIARPLKDELERRGYAVFLDDDLIAAGDELGEKIDEGLAKARRGVVVLSPAFFAKDWPRFELDRLLAREAATGETILIPIWHGVDEDDVRRLSPQLANRLALTSDAGIEALALGIERALQRRGPDRPQPVAGAGAADASTAADEAVPPRTTRTRRLVDWFKGEERSRFDRLLLAVLAGLIIAAVLGLATLAIAGLENVLSADDGRGRGSLGQLDTLEVGAVANGAGAMEERSRRLISAAESRLKRFVRSRRPGFVPPCRSAGSIPRGALASVMCRVQGRLLRFTRFRGRGAVRAHFAVYTSATPDLEEFAGPCYGGWDIWTWNDERAGEFALGRSASETRIIWTYDGHRVTANARAGPTSAAQLCALWTEMATLQ